MLNENQLLRYVKTNLRVPYQMLEITDEQILQHIKDSSLLTYSQYKPAMKYAYVDIENDCNKVLGQENMFKILDPDDADILGVKDVIYSHSLLIFNHPYFGPFNYSSLPAWYSAVVEARTTALSSVEFSVFEFVEPNLVRLYHKWENFIAIYEAEHVNFSTIHTKFKKTFMDLALADILLLVGSYRTQIGALTTPFGDINLNADSLITRGDALMEKTITDLRTIPPETMFDVDLG